MSQNHENIFSMELGPHDLYAVHKYGWQELCCFFPFLLTEFLKTAHFSEIHSHGADNKEIRCFTFACIHKNLSLESYSKWAAFKCLAYYLAGITQTTLLGVLNIDNCDTIQKLYTIQNGLWLYCQTWRKNVSWICYNVC